MFMCRKMLLTFFLQFFKVVKASLSLRVVSLRQRPRLARGPQPCARVPPECLPTARWLAAHAGWSVISLHAPRTPASGARERAAATRVLPWPLEMPKEGEDLWTRHCGYWQVPTRNLQDPAQEENAGSLFTRVMKASPGPV